MRSICYICSCDSLDKLKQKLPSLEREIADGAKFKDFYQFTFNYAKNSGQKSLDLEMALAYWDIVLKDRFRFLGHWCKFLKVSTYLTLTEYNFEPFVQLKGEPQAVNTEGHMESAPRLRGDGRRSDVQLRRERCVARAHRRLRGVRETAGSRRWRGRKVNSVRRMLFYYSIMHHAYCRYAIYGRKFHGQSK